MEIDDFTILMKALSDSNRVRALMALRFGELCVCQVIELLNLAPSTVSKHMSILKHAKLVKSRKSGRWIYYRLATDGPEAIRKLIRLTIDSLAGSTVIKEDDHKLDFLKNCDLEELCRKIMKGGKS
jgi:ArsR family transcriptional regulator